MSLLNVVSYEVIYVLLLNKERLHSAIDYLTPDKAYYSCTNSKCYNPQKVLLEVA